MGVSLLNSYREVCDSVLQECTLPWGGGTSSHPAGDGLPSVGACG